MPEFFPKPETWAEIKDYEGIYLVSSYGKIKVLNRTWTSGKGVNRSNKEREINFNIRRGYYSACLFKNGNRQYKSVARIVAVAFIPNPENKPEVNHKDGNKLNNYVDNLEWATGSENQLHAFKLGLQKPRRGSENKLSKLSAEQVAEIKNSNLTGRKLAEIYNVDPMTISRVKRGITYNAGRF